MERTPTVSTRFSDYLVHRTVVGHRLKDLADRMRRRAVPNHWSIMFGVVSMACLVVVFATGVFLMFFYTPASTIVEYHGSYLPLRNIDVSKAFDSTLHVSFEVRGGLLMRQAHHWAALLLPASLILQLLTTFFTGGFRRPRRLSWVLLFIIFMVALVDGWSGYALPDDMLSGTGLRIVEGIVLAIPVVGTWSSSMLFGGQFPGEVIAHLYPIHVVIAPILLMVFLAFRIRLGYLQRSPQFANPGRAEDNVVGVPLLPTAAARAGGLLFVVMGLLFLVSATVTIGPVWLYGPAASGDASAGSQPDWYTGFLDGALRLVPPGWEFVWLGHTWTLAVLVPLAVVTLFLAFVVLYPFVEEWITGDTREHHLLDRPRNTPSRTAVGVAGIVFYGALWGAGSSDLLSSHFHLDLASVVVAFRVLVVIGPTVAFVLTRRVCLGLQRKDREIVLHGYETGRVVRLPGGEYVEIHHRLDDYERWRLVDVERHEPLALRPDSRGRITLANRLKTGLSAFFFEDRISPVTPMELAATRESRAPR